MTDLVIAPLLAVLVTCATTLTVRYRRTVQQIVSIAGTLVYTGFVGVLVWRLVFAPNASSRNALVYQVGGHDAPFGITLVVDALSAFMLSMTAIVAVYAIVVSVLYIDEDNQKVYYHPLFHFLVLGATGAFLTGDLFNLFVWFEVMLMASYVFVAFYGGAKHTAGGIRFIILNTVGSVLMLLAIGGLYASLGTLNMADMAETLAEGGDFAPVIGFSALLLATFGLKAGLVPFQFWVPSAYRSAPLPITAVFAGATKKVGIYAIIRVYFTAFGNASISTSVPVISVDGPLGLLAPVLLVMGSLSILVGGVGAVSRPELDGLFAYSSIGQVGFMAVAVAIAAASESLRHVGILAALIFAMHHALTKVLLFLSTAVIRDGIGTTRIDQLGGLGDRSPVFASVFLVGGLSLVGIPPLAGFFGKLLVFDTAAKGFTRATAGEPIQQTVAVVTVLVLLFGAVLTILYSTRAWIGSFWGEQTQMVSAGTLNRTQIGVLATLATLVFAIGVGFEPLYQFADGAAQAALDTDGYVDAVDPGECLGEEPSGGDHAGSEHSGGDHSGNGGGDHSGDTHACGDHSESNSGTHSDGDHSESETDADGDDTGGDH